MFDDGAHDHRPPVPMGRVLRRVGTLCLWAGGTGVVLACRWWASIYGGIEGAVVCLYDSPPLCQWLALAAVSQGREPYEPHILWRCGALAVVGMVLRYCAKPRLPQAPYQRRRPLAWRAGEAAARLTRRADEQ